MNFDKDSAENRACMAKAKPGEPMFIVLGRDPTMVGLLEAWVAERRRLMDAGLIPATAEDRAHVRLVQAMVQPVLEWQRHEADPTKQKAYEAQRAAHYAKIGRVGA